MWDESILAAILCDVNHVDLVEGPGGHSYIMPIPEMVEYAKGKSNIYPINREGVVCRSFDRSFKVINPDFLIEHNL